MTARKWLPALFVGVALSGAEPPACTDPLATLAGQQRWEDVVRCFPSVPHASADAHYSYGIALARLERWDEAKRALEEGAAKAPADKRFPLELAGIAFKQELFPAARRNIEHALRLDPTDSYANDFLATLYMLDGNLDAALKYWNRVGKPRIEQVQADPDPHLDAVLLDRAFAFSPGSVLSWEELAASRKRIELLGVFPVYRFELSAREDVRFDIRFHAFERAGWGSGRLGAALGLLRGLPYETVYPEYFNAGHRAINFRSLLRWDSNKRRVFLSLSGPMGREAKRRYEFFFDGRDENWQVAVDPDSLGSFGLSKQEAGVSFTSVETGRFTWNARAALAHRSFPGATSLQPASARFTDGWLGRTAIGFEYRLFQRPEHRITLDSSAGWEIARVWDVDGSLFSQAGTGLTLRWLPRSRNDDYATTLRWRAGTTLGDAPFDALYSLGLERDNDLWLRGHIGTRDGRKGGGPLGDRYTLFNSEVDKQVYRNPLLTFSIGPFLDAGWISDSAGSFGSNGWLWDAGLQCKIRSIDGLMIRLIYGRSLRSGRGGFYGSSSR